MKKMILFVMFFCFMFFSFAKAEWFCPELKEDGIRKYSNTTLKYSLPEVNIEVLPQGSWDKTRGYSPWAKVTFYDKKGKKLYDYDSSIRSNEDQKLFLLFDGYPSFCIGTYDNFKTNDKPQIAIMTAGPSVEKLFGDLAWSKKDRGFFFSPKTKEVNFYLQIIRWFPDGGYWEVAHRVFTPPMKYNQKGASEKAINQAIGSLEKNVGVIRSAFSYISKGDAQKANQYFSKKLSSKSRSKIIKDNKRYLAKIAQGEVFFEYLGRGSSGTIYFDYYDQEERNTESIFLNSGKIEEVSFYDQY